MRMTFNWGTGIAVVYTAFAIAITGFVTFAMGRPVDLVSGDYYERSLQHNQTMDAERQARALQPAPFVTQTSGRAAVLSLPPAHVQTARGTVTFYRPSDANADRTLPLTLDANGRQSISLAGMLEGRWLLQVRWSAGEHSYYVEHAVDVR